MTVGAIGTAVTPVAAPVAKNTTPNQAAAVPATTETKVAAAGGSALAKESPRETPKLDKTITDPKATPTPAATQKNPDIERLVEEINTLRKDRDEMIKKFQNIDRVFATGTEFIRKNFGGNAPIAPPSAEETYRLKMEADNNSKKVNQLLVLGEINALQKSLDCLKTTSESLKSRVLDIKVRELKDNDDGKTKTILYKLQEFTQELKVHEENLGTVLRAVKYEVKQVRPILNDLNELEEITPQEDIDVRNQFETKWNAICSQSHTLRWEVEYLADAIALLPKLKDLDERLGTKESEAQKAKYKYKDRKLDEKDVTELKKELTPFQSDFTKLDEEHTKASLEVIALLKKLEAKALKQEHMVSFVHHNESGEAANKQNLEAILKIMNAQRAQLAKNIVIEWKKTCEHIKTLRVEIAQMGWGAENKSIPWKGSIDARMGYAGDKFAKVTTDYDTALEFYNK